MSPSLDYLSAALCLTAQERREVASLAPSELDMAADAIRLLEKRLVAGRLPEIARRPAGAYGGRTMLEMLVSQSEDLRRIVRTSLDFSTSA